VLAEQERFTLLAESELIGKAAIKKHEIKNEQSYIIHFTRFYYVMKFLK